VALTNVVVRLAPFQRTTDDEAKLLPLTVNVKADPPVAPLLGARDVATGAGLMDGSTVTGGLVASRVYPLFRNKRNSYVPAVAGNATVHVLVVTPAPTYVQLT
jgi:hypothetical protein